VNIERIIYLSIFFDHIISRNKSKQVYRYYSIQLINALLSYIYADYGHAYVKTVLLRHHLFYVLINILHLFVLILIILASSI